jgi:hypothetical protein
MGCGTNGGRTYSTRRRVPVREHDCTHEQCAARVELRICLLLERTYPFLPLIRVRAYTHGSHPSHMHMFYSDGRGGRQQIMYGVLYALSPEIFPAKDRGTGNALTATATRVFGVLVRLLFIPLEYVSRLTTDVTGRPRSSHCTQT